MKKNMLYLRLMLLSAVAIPEVALGETLHGVTCASGGCMFETVGDCPIVNSQYRCTLPTIQDVKGIISPLSNKVDETDQRLTAAQTKSISDLRAELTLKIDQVAADSIKSVLDNSSIELTKEIKDVLLVELQAEFTKNLGEKISSLEDSLSQDLEEKLKKYIDDKLPSSP